MFVFSCPRSRLRIWSRETGSAVPSRVCLTLNISCYIAHDVLLIYFSSRRPRSTYRTGDRVNYLVWLIVLSPDRLIIIITIILSRVLRLPYRRSRHRLGILWNVSSFLRTAGGRGYDDFVPAEVTKTAPSRDETTRSPTWSASLPQVHRIWPGGWSNMSPVGAIFVPFPPKTGANMLHPLPPQSLNLPRHVSRPCPVGPSQSASICLCLNLPQSAWRLIGVSARLSSLS